MLDEEHLILGKQQYNNNNYTLDYIYNHNIVIACMPVDANGLVNTANVAKNMVRMFSALCVCLIVSISRGIPNLEKASTCNLEILLLVNLIILGGI